MTRRHQFLRGNGRTPTATQGRRCFRQLRATTPDIDEAPLNCLGCSGTVPDEFDLTMSGWSWLAPASNSCTDSSINLNTAGPGGGVGVTYDCEVDYEFRSKDIADLNTTTRMEKIGEHIPQQAGTLCNWFAYDLKSTTIQYHRGTSTSCDPAYSEGTTQTLTTYSLTVAATNTGTHSGCGSASQADRNWYEVDVVYGFIMDLKIVLATKVDTTEWEVDAVNGTKHWCLTVTWYVGRWHAAKAQTNLGTLVQGKVGRATFAGTGNLGTSTTDNPGHITPHDTADTSNGPTSCPPYRYTPNANTAGDFGQVASSLSYWREVDCDDVTDPSFTLTRSTSTVEEARRNEWDVTAPSTITLAAV